jgi:hypothetical protein
LLSLFDRLDLDQGGLVLRHHDSVGDAEVFPRSGVDSRILPRHKTPEPWTSTDSYSSIISIAYTLITHADAFNLAETKACPAHSL